MSCHLSRQDSTQIIIRMRMRMHTHTHVHEDFIRSNVYETYFETLNNGCLGNPNNYTKLFSPNLPTRHSFSRHIGFSRNLQLIAWAQCIVLGGSTTFFERNFLTGSSIGFFLDIITLSNFGIYVVQKDYQRRSVRM